MRFKSLCYPVKNIHKLSTGKHSGFTNFAAVIKHGAEVVWTRKAH